MDQNKSQCPKMATTRITSRREEENMKNVKNIVKITATIAILFSFGMVFPTTAVSAQSDRTYQSEDDGFRLQVPQGWVIEDHDNIPQGPNGESAALLCLENEALPGLGGEHNCQAANLTDAIYINIWPDLQSMPEFQNESSSNGIITPTIDDMVALWVRYLQNVSASQIKIVNATDVNEFTKIVNMTYQVVNNAGTLLPFDDYTYNVKAAVMLALSQDRNTGYSIVNALSDHNIYNQTEFSPAVQEVFNSFEILE
jgi:hypothetical protein